MSRSDTAMLVVDVQEKLVPSIINADLVVWNIERLLDGAEALGVRSVATEQYPRGLGPTVKSLADRLAATPEKLTFSCGGCPQIFDELREAGVFKILVVGIETHVCVQQTALDLLASGFRVYIAVDAVGSRNAIDYDTALRRMDSAGATLTTTEAALFEWCAQAATPEFKRISAIVRRSPPVEASSD